MSRRVLIPGGIVVAISLAFAPLAAAADPVVQFETTSTGTRVLTTAVAPTFAATNNLTVSQTIATTAPATSLVTEVLAAGSNPWSVKAQMCGPDVYSAPVSGDCVNEPARMVRVDSGTGDDMIAGSIIAVSHGAPVVVAGGGTTTAGSEADLGGQITLLNNTGQLPLTAYSGTYASTTNLSISSFTRIGTWKGMWVVTATL